MKKKNHTLLLHPFFIACLFLLLLNDIVLKYQYPNWVTGKLSDFAGIAAFVIFFTSVIPQKKSWVYAITVIAFMWWKSPLSQPFINFSNSSLHIPIGRVVDYTDYAALLILFCTWPLKPLRAFTLYKKMATYMLGGISVFAFCATEAPRYMQTRERNVYMESDYKTTLNEQQILERMDSMHISYIKDSFDVTSVYLSRGDFFYTQKDTTADTLKYIYLPRDGFTKLYNRYSTNPYIAITNFVINGDTIPKIKIRIDESYNGKKNYIQLEDIQLSAKTYDNYLTKPGTIRKDYRKRIYEDIIKKLQ